MRFIRPWIALLLVVIGALCMSLGRADDAKPEDYSFFGSSTNPGTALIGIFYDTKQNQKRAQLGGDYIQTWLDFVATGWDESFLSRFYRGTRPVYATQIFIPNMGAAAAPKAFGLEKYVKSTRWFVIYKGQVSPPEDGTYRFVGVADDVMSVAVNGKTELVSAYAHEQPWKDKVWTETDDPATKSVEGRVHHGDWFECKKTDVIDLDVLIGEFPGNLFGAWLFIEKKGAHYDVVNDPQYGAQTVLPVFQVAKQAISREGQPIPFTTNSPPWTCHQ